MNGNGCFEVLTPQEIGEFSVAIRTDAEQAQMPPAELAALRQQLEDFRGRWEKAFSRFKHHPAGELTYQDLLLSFQEQIAPTARKYLRLSDGKGRRAMETIGAMSWPSPPPSSKRISRQILDQKKLPRKPSADTFLCPEFERPLFIVSAPRAGSTLLFETLAQFPEVWTIGEESHETIEGIPELHPIARNYSSNRLIATDARPSIAETLRERFARQLQDRAGRKYYARSLPERSPKVRFLEKTPKNALRIPFLKAVFPEALFIYLYRDPQENISSLMEGWRSRRFVAYRGMPGWPFKEWSFLLVPGWESLQDCALAEIAAYQWKTTNAYILEDLQALPASGWCLVRYADLIRQPQRIIRKISDFAGLCWDPQIEQRLAQSLPISRLTLSAPAPDKWRKHEREIAAVLPMVEPIFRRIEGILAC